MNTTIFLEREKGRKKHVLTVHDKRSCIERKGSFTTTPRGRLGSTGRGSRGRAATQAGGIASTAESLNEIELHGFGGGDRQAGRAACIDRLSTFQVGQLGIGEYSLG